MAQARFAMWITILVTLAGATPGAAASRIDGELTIPAPAVDDRGIYTLTRVLAQGDTYIAGEERIVERFAWLQPGPQVMPDGSLREASRVFEQVDDDGDNLFSYVRVVDHQTARRIGEARLDVSQAGNVQYDRTYFQYAQQVPSQGYATDAPFCGLFMPQIQGRSIPLDEDVVLFRSSCSLPRLDGVAPVVGLTFRAVDRDVVGETTATAFVSLPDQRATVWLSPDHAYPLRISLRHAGAADPTFDVYRLTHFDQGVAAAIPTGGGSSAAPIVELAARAPWGPKDDLDAPFTLREALEAADSELGSELRAFRNSHPAAYMSQANYGEVLGGPKDRREWHFTFTDAREQLIVHVEQHTDVKTVTPGAVASAGAPRLLQSADQGTTYTRISYEAPPIDPEQAPPPPELVPAELPTTLSALRLWETVADPALAARPARLLGFSIFLEKCVDQGRQCDRAHATIDVGHEEVVDGEQGPQLVSSVLRLDERGLLLAVDETYTWPAPAPPSRQIAWATSAIQVDSEVAGSAIGDLAITFGSASLFALAGILAFLWLSKSAIFALYSRLLPSKDESEARRRILRIIEATPGIHTAGVARAARIPEGTARYHLRALHSSGQICVARLHGFRTYQLRGTPPTAALATVFRSAGARSILAAIQARPGTSGRDVALATGLNPATVTYHVARLRRTGIIAAERQGKEMRLHLTTLGGEIWRTRAAATRPDTASASG